MKGRVISIHLCKVEECCYTIIVEKLHGSINYTVSQKKIPGIFDCDLKTSCQILIIFGTNIPDTECHQITI